ncbi:hypothetical protein [Giesbergeria anulus]|uniref:Uncharacterized protein n=1 Tax=Giesbergeria anulus TaxID=180197 RepID=A0A1H9L729_9BURK|nr:hypothetical protein [Giesbergeria anulus]SER07236.1 hypothetical protein SAMN02982919_01683 [Giesbergeria anulus]
MLEETNFVAIQHCAANGTNKPLPSFGGEVIFHGGIGSGWVVVDVRHRVGEIHFIPNAVFPTTPLPNRLLFFVGTTAPHGEVFFGRHFGGKPTLDVLPVH